MGDMWNTGVQVHFPEVSFVPTFEIPDWDTPVVVKNSLVNFCKFVTLIVVALYYSNTQLPLRVFIFTNYTLLSVFHIGSGAEDSYPLFLKLLPKIL